MERPAETSRSRYVERVKELNLEDLECRQELAEALGLERVSHEALGLERVSHEDKSKNNGDGGSDGNSHIISHGTYQLQASQVAGESGTHSGASQASNEHCQNQVGNSSAVEVGRQAIGPKRDGIARCRL